MTLVYHKPDWDPIRDAGAFTLTVQKGRFDDWERLKLPTHDQILKPLLSMAEECWAYGVDEKSEIYSIAKPILTKSGRRHSVALAGDPVTGYEYFWNANCGKRGTIVIFVPERTFQPESVIPHCLALWPIGNFRSGHTPSAVTFAMARVRKEPLLAFCIPRNNGFDQLDVFMNPVRADAFTDALCRLIPDRP